MDEKTRSLDALPETVRTETLPEGALFVSPDGVLYQVVLAEGAGFRKAEPWPTSSLHLKSETRQPVALVPGSLLARNYPVVAEGRRLPTLTRSDIAHPDGAIAHYVFPSEPLAKLAAQLDETLTPQSGLAAQKDNRRWILGDGHHVLRMYHYRVDGKGEEVDLPARFEAEHIQADSCDDGPRYWKYIPGWVKTSLAPTPAEQPKVEMPLPAPASAAPEPSAPPVKEPPVAVVASVPFASIREPSVSLEHRFDFRSLLGRFSRRDKRPEKLSVTAAIPPGAPLQPINTAEDTKPQETPRQPEAFIAQPVASAPSDLIVAATTQTAESTPAPAQDTAAAQPTPIHPLAPKPRKPRRNLMMVLSVDIGYGYTKGVGADNLRFSFPSVVGTAEDIRFATNLISGDGETTVKFNDWQFFYGEQALLQSRIQSTIFDRSRVHDQIYKMLFVAALVELTKLAPDTERVKVVTGLPVEFLSDRGDVVRLFEGPYTITTDRTIRCTVESVFVAPQPFGSLFRELLNDQGKITSTEIEKGRIGVIDVGTYTTDFIVADELRYVQRLSGSVRIGWSKVVGKVQQALSDMHRLDLTPHQVDRALEAGEVRVRGEAVPLQPLMEPAAAEIRAALIARARDLWGEGANLDAILVTGGGAIHLYDAIEEAYPHARLLDNAFWANAEGFQRFARRPATFRE